MKCPLSASQYGDLATCVKTDCIFADAAGECLVKQALLCYVSAERTRVAQEKAREREEIERVKMYWDKKNY